MTTARLNLLMHPYEVSAIVGSGTFKLILQQYFNMLVYQPGINYNKKDTVVITNSFQIHNVNAPRTGKKGKFWYEQFRKQGFKIIVANLWEDNNFLTSQFPKKHLLGSFVLENINWFWYNESFINSLHLNSLQGQSSNYSADTRYNKYKGGHITTEHLALMPIGRVKPFRTALVDQLRNRNLLDLVLWSYLDAYNNPLPGDAFPEHTNPTRWLNPAWYNNTYFSIAAESRFEHPGVFITEKTFKPIAYYHPFVVVGQPGTLAHLKSIGFETYNNLFNESYDNELDHTKRMSKVIDNVQSFNCVPYDRLTIEKLHHNRNHFYNTALIKQRILDEIINPILEYAAA
jgi:hypothetical protein